MAALQTEIPERLAPWGASGQAGEAAATVTSPAALLAADPTGQDCLDALGRWGRGHGIRLTRVLQLAGLPASSSGNLRIAKQPKPETVARVRAIIALDNVPDGPIGTPVEALLPSARRRGPCEVRAIAAPENRPEPARPSITEQAAKEAEAAGRRRSIARMIGHSQIIDAPPMAGPAAIQAGFLQTPNDAMRSLVSAWPALWHRLIDESKAAGQLPGAYFFAAIERGLDALAGDA